MDEKQYKQALLDGLNSTNRNCNKCPLGGLGRKNIVHGEGNPNASLMFLGEGPGRDEDLHGKPFVGKSGQLLNKTLELVGIDRENSFITNIVKCRPPGNRLPTKEESASCKNLFLFNQVKIICPKIICTLGSHAIQELLQKPLKISHIRGKSLKLGNITVIPTYHPAYILRNPRALTDFIEDIRLASRLSINKYK